jgi:hypothetical protein
MTDGFEAPYWTLLQGLAWVFLGDPKLVTRCGAAAPDRRFGQEQILPDKTKIVSLTSPDPPSTLTIDVAAAARGAGVSAATVTTVGAENEPRLPAGMRLAVPAPASEQFERPSSRPGKRRRARSFAGSVQASCRSAADAKAEAYARSFPFSNVLTSNSIGITAVGGVRAPINGGMICGESVTRGFGSGPHRSS